MKQREQTLGLIGLLHRRKLIYESLSRHTKPRGGPTNEPFYEPVCLHGWFTFGWPTLRAFGSFNRFGFYSLRQRPYFLREEQQVAAMRTRSVAADARRFEAAPMAAYRAAVRIAFRCSRRNDHVLFY